MIVKFETAKLAKEKGFNRMSKLVYVTKPFSSWYGSCRGVFTIGELADYGKILCNDDDIDWSDYYTFAPTQHYLQKWLREVPKWPVEILYELVITDKPRKYRFKLWQRGKYYEVGTYSDFEKGLEDSLYKGLELL